MVTLYTFQVSLSQSLHAAGSRNVRRVLLWPAMFIYWPSEKRYSHVSTSKSHIMPGGPLKLLQNIPQDGEKGFPDLKIC